MELSLDLFLRAQGSLIFWTRTAPWPTNVNPTAVRCHLLQFCPSMPSFVFAFFFWRSCVARIYCFARSNRGACSQAILGEKGELWGERDGGGEPCRGLRRPDHSLSPAFFRYFALRLLLAIFPLKEALSQVNSNQEWPGPNRSKTGTLFLSGLLLGFSFTKVLLCVFAPSCMS